MPRPAITNEQIQRLLGHLEKSLIAKNDRHSGEGFVSSHEMLGVVTEEYYELVEAVKSNHPRRIQDELEDVLAACFFSLASYIYGKPDW